MSFVWPNDNHRLPGTTDGWPFYGFGEFRQVHHRPGRLGQDHRLHLRAAETRRKAGPGHDGVRRTRFAIVRQTLQQLRMTVLLDILSWLRPIASYKVSDQLITIQFRDIYSEWYLIPLEDEDDQKRLLSMQLTGAFLSEAIEMDVDLVDAIAGRCGRFPSAADGGCTWFGLIGDTNAPVIGSAWYEMFEDEQTARLAGVPPALRAVSRAPRTSNGCCRRRPRCSSQPTTRSAGPGAHLLRAPGARPQRRLDQPLRTRRVRRGSHPAPPSSRAASSARFTSNTISIR